MAEFVQQRKEEWVSVLTELERMSILTKKERKDYVENIDDFEHSLQNPSRTLDQILKYADLQQELLNKIKERRQELQLFEKQQEIEENIKHKMNSLFGVHERNFRNCHRYWMARLAFVKKQGWPEQTYRVFEGAIAALGHENPVWYKQFALSEWLRHPPERISTAIDILMKGMRVHRHNLKLNVWLFQAHLRHVEFLMKQNAKNDSLKDYATEIAKYEESADMVYRNAMITCLEIGQEAMNLYLKFLKVTLRCGAFKELQDGILRDIEERLGDRVTTYTTLVEILLARDGYGAARDVLLRGCDKINSAEMYNAAIKIFLDLRRFEAAWSDLHKMFVQGLERDWLSEESFVSWLAACSTYEMKKSLGDSIKADHCPETNKLENDEKFSEAERLQVLDRALVKYPNSLTLLAEMYKSKATNAATKTEELHELFARMNRVASNSNANENFPNETVFWTLLSLFNSHPCHHDKLRSSQILDRFLNVSPELTAHYLRYLNLTNGIQAVRVAYPQLALRNAYLVMKAFAELEFTYMDHGLEQEARCKPFRTIMEQSCLHHGKDRIDVWLDYIEFEKQLNNLDKVAEIYSRGLQSIQQPNLKEQLILQYSTIQQSGRKRKQAQASRNY